MIDKILIVEQLNNKGVTIENAKQIDNLSWKKTGLSLILPRLGWSTLNNRKYFSIENSVRRKFLGTGLF